MNKLISIALAGALSTLICGAVLADDMGMGKDSKTSMEQKMAKKQADKLTMMTKTLSLTPDQATKVSDILKATGDQKKAMMMKMEADEKAMHDSENSQIKAILTPDQRTKYDAMMMEHKNKMKGEKQKM